MFSLKPADDRADKGASLSRAMSRFHDCILAMRAVPFRRAAFLERLLPAAP